jgi:PAS domain S-box-containing protein
MNDQDKTKEELIIELQKLKQENSDLKALHDDIDAEIRREDILLQQTRKNYETFFNTINDFLFVLDEQGNIIHTNSTVIDRLGYTREELSGLSVLMVHPLDRRDEAGRIVEEMLKGITEFCPVPIVTKSGIQIPVETRVTPGIWDGKPVIFGVTKDISKVKLSEEKFSKVFYLNPSVCGLSDLETGKYVEVNDQFYTLLGFEKNEVIGKTATDLGILTTEIVNAVMSKAERNGTVTNIEADLKAKNGDIKHVLLSAENIYIQDKKYRFTVVHDITKLKKAEDEISRQAGMISSLLDSIPDIIFFKDKNGVYLGCNPPFAEFVGRPRNEIIGKTDYDLFDKEIADFFRKYDKSMLEVCKSQQNEEWITYPDGRKILIDTLKTPYWGPDGTLIGLLGISRDITERKHAENEIKLKNEELLKLNFEKDKFFSIIAHDLRSPFTGFLGLTEIMVVDLPNLSMNKIQEFAVNIRTSATNLYRLLNNLLEWAQIQKGTINFYPSTIKFLVLVDECLSLIKEFAKTKEIEIVLDIPAGLEIFADKNMLQTVISNFVSNAVKFTQKGGKVNLSAKINDDNCIEISIKDTGIGMSQHMIDDLFRIDVQTVRKGTEGELSTGLGLLLCKEFVEKHEGKIWVESIVGVGTTFNFSLSLSLENVRNTIGK